MYIYISYIKVLCRTTLKQPSTDSYFAQAWTLCSVFSLWPWGTLWAMQKSMWKSAPTWLWLLLSANNLSLWILRVKLWLLLWQRLQGCTWGVVAHVVCRATWDRVCVCLPLVGIHTCLWVLLRLENASRVGGVQQETPKLMQHSWKPKGWSDSGRMKSTLRLGIRSRREKSIANGHSPSGKDDILVLEKTPQNLCGGKILGWFGRAVLDGFAVMSMVIQLLRKSSLWQMSQR